jgi:hypothetical protein
MLDTRLPDYQLSYSSQRLPDWATVRSLTLQQRVWNALVPKSAVEFKIEEGGVRYLHATKGWKWVGKKRFAIRGVL